MLPTSCRQYQLGALADPRSPSSTPSVRTSTRRDKRLGIYALTVNTPLPGEGAGDVGGGDWHAIRGVREE